MEDFRVQINSLLGLIAKGNEQAVEELYNLAGGRMLSVAFGVLRNRELSEEVVSESFMKIVSKAGSFLRGSNGYAWICKITQNTALNKLKIERAKRTVPLENIYSLSDNCDEYAKTESSIDLEKAMSKLDAYEKKLIYLRYFFEMGVRDIAKEIGESKSTVARKLIEAEAHLKELMQ